MILLNSPFGILTLYLLSFTVPCVAEDDDDNKPQPAEQDDCDCFLTNGLAPAYYTHRRFFDFRSLSEFAGVPKILKNHTETSLAPPSSDYFDNDDFTDVWELANWDNGFGIRNKDEDDDEQDQDQSILMVYSLNNVYIQENKDKNADSDTYMTMRTKRLPDFQTAAEIESTEDYLFASVRMMARTTGASGAVTAMFTYRDSKELANVQEADIEFLTRGPRDKVQYTNQPSYSVDGDEFPEATRNSSTPNGQSWTEWMVHRLDWTPERSVWYINDEEVANIQYQTPTDPARIMFNAWSNGGSWSGNMSDYDEAYLQIQWIDMVFNKTDEDDDSRKRSTLASLLSPRLRQRDDDNDDEDSCDYVCSIDESSEAGEVVKLWDSAAPALGKSGWGNSSVLIIIAGMTLLLLTAI